MFFNTNHYIKVFMEIPCTKAKSMRGIMQRLQNTMMSGRWMSWQNSMLTGREAF